MKKTLKQIVNEEYQSSLQKVTVEHKRKCKLMFFNVNHVEVECGRKYGHKGYHLEANVNLYDFNHKIINKYYKVFTPVYVKRP